MAINDIKYSQLPEIPIGNVTDETIFSVVESEGNFRLSFAAIKALTAFDMTALDPLTRNEVDGDSLLHMFSTIDGNITMTEFLSYTSRLTLLPEAEETDVVEETEIPIHFNNTGKKMTIAQLRTLLDSIPNPRGSLRLEANKDQTITEDVTPIVLTAFDALVTERNGLVVNPITHDITYTGPDVDSAIITLGLNATFTAIDELEMYLYINGEPYSDTPINIQGDGSGSPVAIFWQSDVPLTTDDVLDVRGRNADTGSFVITYLRATFRVDIN